VPAFVGRTEELRILGDLVAAAAEAPAAAVVVGEPGSGKTRLLQEISEQAPVPNRFRVIGYEPESEVPLSSASRFLTNLAEAAPHGRRLEELLFADDVREAGAIDPLRVFEAAHRAVRALGPTLLMVDDLQWVDAVSLALCHYLGRAAEAGGQPLALLAVTRPSANASSLISSLSTVLPPERFRQLELGPLEPDEALALVKEIAPAAPDDVARGLAAKSGGSPFWLEALVRGGDGDVDTGRLVTARLRGASPDASTLLSLLAIAARPIALADAAELSGWEPERAEQAASDLLARGIALERGGTITLAHDLIRAAAASEIPEERRLDVHRRIGDWLASLAGDDVQRLREALVHRHAARAPSVDLAKRLLVSPHRTLLGTDGLRLLASIADEVDPFDPDAPVLQEQVASLASELGEHEEATERWSLVAERTHDPLRRASALLAASRAAHGLGHAPEARELLDRSRAIETDDDVLRVEQDTHEAAILLWLEQRTAEGEALARDAVAAATELADRAGGVGALDARTRRPYIDALRLEYEAAIMTGDVEATLRAAEARQAAAEGFDLESYLTASIAVCLALRQNGRVHEAIDRGRRVWAEAQRRVLPRLVVDGGFWQSRTLAVAGNLDEAELILEHATEVAARAGDVPRARHRLARQAAAIGLERGRPLEVLRRLEATEEPNEHQRIMLHGDLALWYSRLVGASATPTIEEHVAKGEACAKLVRCKRCEAELLLFAAEALARVDRREAAEEALARWETLGIRETLDAHLRLHVGALVEADVTGRVQALEEALAATERSPFGLLALWIRLDLGRELASLSRERAIEELEETVARASGPGAATVVELAEQALRGLGIRTWRRGAAAETLSDRERQIVELVAAGASNPEIAQELFLSRKTVERHVSNVLRKVGARNRAELAAKVAELKVEGAPR
jgi:DNA-binding NarL/FixJ family response regulator